MGKREVRTIVVPKWVTVTLLVLISAAMIGLLYFLSGRAYAGESNLAMLMRLASLRRDALLAVLMPFIGNALLFVPWGFLAFIAADSPSRPRTRSYAITLVGGLVFAMAMHAWQHLLPTRVTTPGDAFANGVGALVGAALGHARKRVRVRFDY